ncbi:MAG: hypothetical protein IKY61_01800, partial [Thermoguttaceae bacterium]|nr:hypothetical protein [Thermoguttaceae bacterium]
APADVDDGATNASSVADSNVDASFLAGKSTLGDADGSTFQMRARNLDLWCVFLSDPEKNRVASVAVDRATLRGGVTLVENSFDGTPQMRVAAKEAELVAPGTDEARVLLVGDATTAATFQMRELALSGYNVVVDRAANAFQVAGPGKLAVRPPAETVAQTAKSPQVARLFTNEPVEIEWAEAMTFDGNALSFRGSEKHDVLISQRTQTLSCREARFTLSRPISIFELDAQATENLDVATVEFLGDFDRPVKIDATTFGGAAPDASDDDAFYQAFLQNLRYERANNRFVATGGGTLRATFRGRGAAQFKLPDAAEKLVETPDASNASASSETWTTVCLKFQNEITGDVARQEIGATGGVRVVACQSRKSLAYRGAKAS